LGVSTVDDLRAAVESGAVATMKGVGPRTLERLRETLSRAAGAGPGDEDLPPPPRVLLVDALEIERRLLPRWRRLPGVHAVEAAGELRRRVETMTGLDVTLSAPDPAASLQAVAADSS